MKIVQVSQTISYGDAISNDVFAIDETLRENGYETVIYAEHFHDKRIKNRITSINNGASKIKSDDIVIYHLCIGTELTYWFKELNCLKVVVYHNITPPEYFEKYDSKMTEITRFGRQSIADLAEIVDYAIADSEYNKKELIQYGYKNVEVLPILIKFDDYKTKFSSKILNKYKDGKNNILFVGRSAPNKKIEDIVIAFDYYKKNIDSNSRLILVGSNAAPVYTEKISSLIQELGTEDIIRAGHVSFPELLAFYKLADVFLCMSEHEGFCVPLLECMYFDVPIVAFNSTAVPETLGDSGVVFNKKDFARVGELLDIVIKDKNVRDRILEKQRERLKEFSTKEIKKRLLTIINSLCLEH